TIAALNEIFPELPVKPSNYQPPKEKKKTREDGNPSVSVMLVKDNLEAVEFLVHRVPRRLIPSNSGLPDSLRSEPKGHQIEAFEWLTDHYKAGSRGVLLADDMGLGKTFQSIMFLSWLREGIERGEVPEEPVLIIAPTGLLKNWEAEIERHLIRDLGPMVRIYGPGIRELRVGNALDVGRLRNAGVVLTTYETVTKYQTSFSPVTFSCAVLDEAQKLKNPGTQNYSAACSLKVDFWIGMTGTPIENRLSDLWAIADILQPGMLGSIKEFSTRYEKAIIEGADVAAQRTKELQDGLALASKNAPAFMIRRMKSERLQGLPDKHLKVYKELMPEVQTRAYGRVIEEVQSADGSKKGAMLEALQKLRACSLHPDYKREDRHWTDQDFIDASGRLKACFRILDQINKEKEKALIFVEYTDWHRPDFLPAIIQRRYSLKSLPMVINGEVSSGARQKRVDEFQSTQGVFDVMLLSPKAGGVGLTLTAANHVIHLTRWWNPAVEDQATDRVYRIGQNLPVYIHYPLAIHPEISERCFDELLHNILENKRKLRDQTLISLPETDEIQSEMIRNSFNVGTPSRTSLKDSYILSGRDYQDLVLRKLENIAPLQGYRVRRTPASWDGGADMIIESTDGEVIGLIQCKHVSSKDKTPELRTDLERAVESYGCNDNVWKIGITNADKISSKDKEWAGLSERHLIVKGEDGLRPELIFHHF
ncbi:MAG: restriction endonuclease, partial [Cyanobacteria bacterium HKST-UBA02]|nr:restriction endonuclease [Cyanobacteria bacterium HKST-UBA02]